MVLEVLVVLHLNVLCWSCAGLVLVLCWSCAGLVLVLIGNFADGFHAVAQRCKGKHLVLQLFTHFVAQWNAGANSWFCRYLLTLWHSGMQGQIGGFSDTYPLPGTMMCRGKHLVLQISSHLLAQWYAGANSLSCKYVNICNHMQRQTVGFADASHLLAQWNAGSDSAALGCQEGLCYSGFRAALPWCRCACSRLSGQSPLNNLPGTNPPPPPPLPFPHAYLAIL